MPEMDVVVSNQTLLGECPAWDEREQVLYWVDIEGKLIHRFDPETGQNQSRETPGRPGSFVFTADPRVLLVAMENELQWFHWESGMSEKFITLEPAGNGNRLNDGKTDRAGRYIVGSMYENPNDGRATGALYSVEADGSFSVLRDRIGVTNGLGFDPVHGRAYFADTHTRKIERYDYNEDSGEFLNEELFFDYGDLPGMPDGACVDAEGYYWSASVYGWAVIRISPGGDVVDRISVPLEKPSMPAFGGPDLKTLYVSTIGMGGSRPSADGLDGATPGSLLGAELDVQGLPETIFAGIPPTFS
ncbi:MAG: SMP-30/gluconolactonase/LRE family protein [Acidimicrobiales bacterium]